VRLDAADEIEAIGEKLILRLGEHGIDRVMANALAMRVDVAAVLGPSPDDEVAAPRRIAFVPPIPPHSAMRLLPRRILAAM
jgi:hypothetical protein